MWTAAQEYIFVWVLGTLLYYDSRELLSLLYDLRCDHNYNVVYAARRIIYGRQTRLGFVIVNIFFYQNISIRRIIDRIFTSTSPINTRVAHPPAIEICSNTCTHTYPTKLPIAHTYLRGTTVRNVLFLTNVNYCTEMVKNRSE